MLEKINTNEELIETTAEVAAEIITKKHCPKNGIVFAVGCTVGAIAVIAGRKIKSKIQAKKAVNSEEDSDDEDYKEVK